MDLPNKLRYNTKKGRIHKHKKRLGRSIEERPESIKDRQEFGHWEIDTVIGQKTSKDEVLLTITERRTRESIVRKILSKTAAAVMEALEKVFSEYGTLHHQVFKSITADNGSSLQTCIS